jgi:hypothetical protein
MQSDSACLVSYNSNGERGKRGTTIVIKVENSLFGLLVRVTIRDTQWRRQANRLSEGQPKQGALANDYEGFKNKEMKVTYS